MSILPPPVTMARSRPRVEMGALFNGTNSQDPLAYSPASTKLSPYCIDQEDSDAQEFGWSPPSIHTARSSRRLVTPSIIITEVAPTSVGEYGDTLSVPAAAHTNDVKLANAPDDIAMIGLVQRVEQLTSLVVKMERENHSRGNTEDALRHEIRTISNQKESLKSQLASLQKVLRSSSKRLTDCVDASTVALELERELRRDVEAKARRAEDRVNSIINENAHLTQAKAAVQRELALLTADAQVWQDKVRATQDMQEMALATYHRCEALEKENAELRQVMHVFAKGSTSMIVQQLQVVIKRLSNEVANQKTREESLMLQNKQDCENRHSSGVLNEMRRKTKALQQWQQVKCNDDHATAVDIDWTLSVVDSDGA